MMKKRIQQRIRITLLFLILYLLTVSGMLLAGLWPFNFYPINNVSWQSDSNGRYLNFKKYSFSYLSPPFKNLHTSEGFTIEIKLQPFFYPTNYVPRIISIQQGKNEKFMISQWKSGLLFHFYDSVNKRNNKFYCKNVFKEKRPVTIILCAGKSGTTIYSDTKTALKSDKKLLPGDSFLNGTMVIGNTVYGNQSWSGKLYNLRIYNRLLTEQEIRTNLKNSSTGFFLFPSGEYELIVPYIFSPPAKKFLTPPWEDFRLSSTYFKDVFLNFFGFIPSGFLLGILLTLKRFHPRNTLLLSFVFCFLISFTIEFTQITLPSRISQLSDLILNVSGGFIGTWIFFVNKTLLRFFNNLNSDR